MLSISNRLITQVHTINHSEEHIKNIQKINRGSYCEENSCMYFYGSRSYRDVLRRQASAHGFTYPAYPGQPSPAALCLFLRNGFFEDPKRRQLLFAALELCTCDAGNSIYFFTTFRLTDILCTVECRFYDCLCFRSDIRLRTAFFDTAGPHRVPSLN